MVKIRQKINGQHAGDSQLCNSKTLSTTILYDVRETLADTSTVIIPPSRPLMVTVMVQCLCSGPKKMAILWRAELIRRFVFLSSGEKLFRQV
jgi:hypothetical protein